LPTQITQRRYKKKSQTKYPRISLEIGEEKFELEFWEKND
jgi:hypothetical protein